MKRSLLILFMSVTLLTSLGAAERITPKFLVDTETSAYFVVDFDLEGESGIGVGLPTLTQDLTVVDPHSTFGVGIRTGLQYLPPFDQYAIPLQAVLSMSYNMKLGFGYTLLPGYSSELENAPSGALGSAMMSFHWPMAKIGPNQLGLMFVWEGYRWSYVDMWDETVYDFYFNVGMGVSLTFDPVSHPANEALYPDYTDSYK